MPALPGASRSRQPPKLTLEFGWIDSVLEHLHSVDEDHRYVRYSLGDYEPTSLTGVEQLLILGPSGDILSSLLPPFSCRSQTHPRRTL